MRTTRCSKKVSTSRVGRSITDTCVGCGIRAELFMCDYCNASNCSKCTGDTRPQLEGLWRCGKCRQTDVLISPSGHREVDEAPPTQGAITSTRWVLARTAPDGSPTLVLPAPLGAAQVAAPILTAIARATPISTARDDRASRRDQARSLLSALSVALDFEEESNQR